VPAAGLEGPSSWVYRGSWLRAWLFALFLSWGTMNLIALLVERRTEMLFHPGGQYKALYYGDSICLPGVAVAIWYLGRYMSGRPGWWHERLWHCLCFGFGLAYGIWWHRVDAHSHFYTRSQMWSPTKLYHDYVVFPLYIYILVSAGIPAMAWSKRGWKARVVIVVLLAAYALLNYYDAVHRPHHGHENFNWGQFWGRFGL
jgi:hypothetical protein